jgi:NADPH2:quinone reductase
MKAQVINRFGPSSVFEPAELPRPAPGPGEVLIRVAASSVNPVDCKIRSGLLQAIAPEFPAVLHGDVAGVVEETGAGVDRFQPGDEVYACAGGLKGLGGALAEYMAADAGLVARKPASLTMAEAAALPLVSITAWEGIARAGVKPGQHVLVHGGTGGVGHVAQQLARVRGARVTVTCGSAAKCEQARALGCDDAVNYRDEDAADYVQRLTDGRGFDVVFDTVGGAVLDQSFAAAALNGAVVSIATRSTHDLTPLHARGLSLHVVFMLIPMLHGVGRAAHGRILEEVAKLADTGRLRPLVDPRAFTLDQAGEAHALLESGGATGKVVLTNPGFGA